LDRQDAIHLARSTTDKKQKFCALTVSFFATHAVGWSTLSEAVSTHAESETVVSQSRRFAIPESQKNQYAKQHWDDFLPGSLKIATKDEA
jgi:hypothetical protein